MPSTNGTTAIAQNGIDSLEYNPLEDLDAIFANPASLKSVTQVSLAIEDYEAQLEDEIEALVEAQRTSDAASLEHIAAAKAELGELFAKIEGVRQRALSTEQSITDMTADIKRLDGTKKNLTLSMTALKRLQMLTTAYEQLRSLCKAKQYRECAHLLQAVIQLMAHFRSYRSIDQIAALSRNVSDLQRELLERICEDFEITFTKNEVVARRAMLAEACLVMDALGDVARGRLVTWYCNTQLREYRSVFRSDGEAGSLDNISRRYAWLRRMLKIYDEEHAAIFPPAWRANEALANSFCESTRDDFKSILARAMRRQDGASLDVNLLLSCLQETLDFEHSLERRFSTDERSSMDTMSSKEDKPPVFSHAISEAFEPYLSVWVEAQDKTLTNMIPRYRTQPLLPDDDEFNPASVTPSSMELVNFYNQSLQQCAKLSTGQRLVELSAVFAKHLDSYASEVLLVQLSANAKVSPPLESIVIVLNTADYMHTRTAQLEEKIKRRVDPSLSSKIEFQSQEDAFMGVAFGAIRALCRRIELAAESAWREMRNSQWNTLESVGDQSGYVPELLRVIRDGAREALGMISKQPYARVFCDNLVDLFTGLYVANIVQCRPISEVGAEQLLLDSYHLKKTFEDLLSITTTDPSSKSLENYIKHVRLTLSRKLDPLLKTLQVRSTPAEGLVQAYLIHIHDSSPVNFRKILDLKGVRKQDQSHLVEVFNAHKASAEGLSESSLLLGNLTLSSGGTGLPGTGSGRFDASALGNAILSVARDARDGLSTPILTAGGVGGGNSPNIGISPSTTPAPGAERGGITSTGSGSGGGMITGGISNTSSSQQPVGQGQAIPQALKDGLSAAAVSSGSDGPTAATAGVGGNLNENLKSIGKFFRRDTFGMFGGSSGGG